MQIKTFYKIKLIFLYLKTRIHQKIFRDGTFPFKFYLKLSEYVSLYNTNKALECGTAIGLTAIAIATGNKTVKLDTVEKHNRNLIKAKDNIEAFDRNNFWNLKERINLVEGRYFDVLETGELKNEMYDFIFLDAYVSRLNEVGFLSQKLNVGGVFVVSNLRLEIPKSLAAYEFLKDEQKFKFLEEIEDTVFVQKLS